MQFLKNSALILATLSIAACSNKEALTKATESAEMEILTNRTSVLTRPILADLEIDQQRASTLYEADLRLPIEDLRENALAQFLSQHHCDYAVDPIYRETVTSVKRSIERITIVIEAFPARYTQLVAVDSLPKSILEYQRVHVPQERISYITERTVPESTVGLEFTWGNYIGFQVDAPLTGLPFRGYFSTSALSDNQMDNRNLTYTLSTSTGTNSSSRSVQDFSSFALGMMKEVEPSTRLSLRGQAGIAWSMYEHSTISVGTRSFDSSSLVGLHISGGADFRLFRNRNVFLVGKFQRNLTLLRFHDWIGAITTTQTTTLDKFRATGPILDFGAGLRFEF